MSKILLILILGYLFITLVETSHSRLDEVFSWNELDFKFPNEELRNSAIESEQYIPGNSVITGIEVHVDRIFLSVPRIKPGVPSTLNYVSLKEIENKEKSPVLIPYPSFEDNFKQSRTSNQPLLTSITHITADACNRLWVIDVGVRDALSSSPKTEKPPTIHLFDLKTDQLLFSYPLTVKKDYNEEYSTFTNIVVDVTSGNCDDAYIYLPDSGSPAIVVYSFKLNETHRLTHNYFHFDPLAGEFYLINKKHQWQEGVYDIALSPIDKDNYRTAYFHPLASTMEFTVSTRVLQNSTLSDKYIESFRILGNRGPNGQSSVAVLDEETGVIFYTQVAKNSIICWNSYKGEDYSSNSLGLVAEDSETLDFPNDITIDLEGFVWVLADKLPQLMYSTLDSNSINIRIYRAPVREAIKGTICD